MRISLRGPFSLRNLFSLRDRFLVVLSVALVLATSVLVVAEAQAEPFLQIRQFPGDLLESAPPAETTVDLRVWVEVDPGALDSAPEQITLTLPEGLAVRARRTSFERRGPGRVTWRGTVGTAREPVILTVHDGYVVGRIHHGDRVYSLAPVHGVHRLARLAPDAFPECGGSVEPSGGRLNRGMSNAEAPTEPRPQEGLGPQGAPMGAVATLDVLIVYTSLARRWAAGVGQGSAAVEALAQSSVDLLNTAFENTRVSARARLVGTVEKELVQGMSEEMSTLLERLTSDPDVSRLRDQTDADLVSLFINATEDGSNLCGLAWAMNRGRVNPQFHHFGFSVSRVQCAVDNLTFPHEVGHNMGGFHQRGAPPPEQASFPWSFGHLVQGSFRTIMMPASECQGSSVLCPRIVNFSNPEVSHQGNATGVRNERDNHRTFNQTAPIVAHFRLGDADRPQAPTDLAARAISGTSVELTWIDRAIQETGYRVDRAEGAGPFAQILTLPPDSTSVIVDDLTPETRYRFHVRARNAAGFSSFSNVAEATTLPDLPPIPLNLSVEALSETALRLDWAPVPRGSVHVEIASPAAEFREIQLLAPGSTEAVIGGLEPETPYTVRLRASTSSGLSPYGDEVSVTTPGRDGVCVTDAESLCLLDGRFEVRVAWRNPRQDGDSGAGHAEPVPGSDISGTFWFFQPENVELIVKMLDGTTLNGSFWHFYGALSDVEYWISVRDTETGAGRTFHNPPFEICGQADTRAFSQEPQAPQSIRSSASISSMPSMPSIRLQTPQVRAMVAGGTEPPSLTFQDGRFEVEVTWREPRSGDRGVGHPVPALSTGETGFLWFFQPDNLELVVKILDGRTINGHFWFFWGGLSDVEYTIRVLDTDTGTETTYTNEAFNLCGGADLETLGPG